MYMIRITKNQHGFVSIMVASVLMVIMALITLGFTRLVQNEQRQAIDSQLSKQAFYAAESGINAAISAPSFPGTIKKDTCDVSGYNNGRISDEEPEVVFTCILINPEPDDLVFSNDSITTNMSKVVPIKTNGPPGSITFQWKDNKYTGVVNDCSAIPEFTVDADSWSKVSPLKVDIVAIPVVIPPETFGRENLIGTHFSAIFTPCVGGVAKTINYSEASGDSNIGKIIPVPCQITTEDGIPTVYGCKVEITDVPSNQQKFYARINALYNNIDVRITANEAVSGDRLLFSEAQAVVDSTGRANDVFQRLQARVPLYDNYILPTAAIQTLQDVCKLYRVQATRVLDNCDNN
jgi:Tfp pilus assembly protein PilX